jgi:hypothetical protein
MTARNATIKITHIATGLNVEFSKYFLTEFQDSIDTAYNKTSTFGRMDPLVTFQGSTRKISLGLEIKPESSLEREGIHRQIRDLQKMQYPVYKKAGNALTISRPPLVAVRYANLMRGGDGNELLCAMEGVAFTPRTGFTPEDSPFVRFGAGSSTTNAAGTTVSETIEASAKDRVTFKKYSLRLNFIVLHRSPMGFSENSDFTAISDTEFIGRKSPSKYNTQEMRFLGGYYFGPHNQTPGADGAQGIQIFNTANEDDEANIHVVAAQDSIFDI